MYGIIYKALNTVNSKVYIGQTTMTLEQRKASHKSNWRCRLIYRAILKYGYDKFQWEILAECESREMLDKNEEFFIGKFQSCNHDFGYNLKSGGEGNGKHSEETKLLLSQIAKASGQKPTNSRTINITIENRLIMSEQRGGKPFECHTKDGKYIGKFVSLGHASKELGVIGLHIRKNLKGRKRTCCGYIFKYL